MKLIVTKQSCKLRKLAFEVDYFLVMVDMAIGSLNSRFEELQASREIFGFLTSSANLKSLDASELEGCCTILAMTFSPDGSSDIELNDLISKVKSLAIHLCQTYQCQLWIVILILPLLITSYLLCL